MARNPMANYQKVQATTATPGQRVILVYKGISSNIKQAINHILASKDDPSKLVEANNAILLAQQLIQELQMALDKENGGEIAKNLEELYIFWYDHLADGNIKKDTKMLRDVLNMVKEMTESWVAAEKDVRKSE